MQFLWLNSGPSFGFIPQISVCHVTWHFTLSGVEDNFSLHFLHSFIKSIHHSNTLQQIQPMSPHLPIRLQNPHIKPVRAPLLIDSYALTYTITKLWKVLETKVQYQTYRHGINYLLESKKIIIKDKKNLFEFSIQN